MFTIKIKINFSKIVLKIFSLYIENLIHFERIFQAFQDRNFRSMFEKNKVLLVIQK